MPELNLRKRGKTWEYYFEAAQIDGQRNRPRKGGSKTKAAAAGNKAMAEYNDAGLHFVPSEISFSDLLDTWISEYGKINLKNTTVVNYKKKIRLHIKPALGMYKTKALTAIVLQGFINKMAKKDYNRNTLSVIKGILTSSLSYAVIMGMIRYSPIANVKLPSPRNKEITSRSEPHIYIPQDKIIAIFKRFPEKSSTHIAMMAGYKGGLRIGEAFALSWDNVMIYLKKTS